MIFVDERTHHCEEHRKDRMTNMIINKMIIRKAAYLMPLGIKAR
jgi:hypothetical protein